MKLWHEMNDGMYRVYKLYRPDRNEFGIIAIQIAGDMIHLNILIKDTDDIHYLYRLCSAKIPVQPSEEVLGLVETLLILRNIVIVNISFV